MRVTNGHGTRKTSRGVLCHVMEASGRWAHMDDIGKERTIMARSFVKLLYRKKFKRSGP